jgi:hypothetical protein
VVNEGLRRLTETEIAAQAQPVDLVKYCRCRIAASGEPFTFDVDEGCVMNVRHGRCGYPVRGALVDHFAESLCVHGVRITAAFVKQSCCCEYSCDCDRWIEGELIPSSKETP